MDRNRRHRKNQNWKNQNNNQNGGKNQQNSEQKKVFNSSNYYDDESEKLKSQAIAEVKAREIICPLCNQKITDLASSLNDKATGNPVHFECAMSKVSESEKLGENEKIAYIGQGRFGVLYFENPRDQRKFTIKKIIEWDERDKVSPWRTEISDLYSKIN